jgi:hypothetical protein
MTAPKPIRYPGVWTPTQLSAAEKLEQSIAQIADRLGPLAVGSQGLLL